MRGLKRLLEKLPKLSHEQLGGVLRDVADENAMLTSIFDSLSTGLIIVDRKWKFLQSNKAADRFVFENTSAESKNLRLPAPTVQCAFYLFLFFHM